MISKVCEAIGCDSETFMIHMVGPKLILNCSKCGVKRLEQEMNNWKFYSKCKVCGKQKYKLNYDDKTNQLALFCANCNEPPVGIETDDEGNPFRNVTDERLFNINKSLNEIKEKLDDIIKEQDRTDDKLRQIDSSLEELYYRIKD